MTHRLLSVDALAPGEFERVVVGGVAILVVRTPDGAFHGLRDRCPHRGASFEHGRLLEHVRTGLDGSGYALDDSEHVIRCPWHGMEYSVATGVCPADEQIRIPRLELYVDDDDVVWDPEGART